MAKKALLAVLIGSIVSEVFLAGAGFFAPSWLMTQFRIGFSADTAFLGHVIAWLLLLIGLVCTLATKYVLENKAAGWSLSYILGFWWMGIGIGIFVSFGRIDNLFLDTVKGALLVAVAYASRPQPAQ